MKANKFKCIKPVSGFTVGEIYYDDIFGWITNGVDRCVFQPECFERTKDE